MARLNEDPITEAELLQYLEESSDFSFELKVLERLNYLGYSCSHGGPYTDPITKKTRQYDIRATTSHKAKTDDHGLTWALAVECKNLKPHCPLLVMTVPRVPAESYHEVYWYTGGNMNVVRLAATESLYPAGGRCGKSLAQVGKRGNDLVGPDSEIYDKWVQALASGDGLAIIPSGKPSNSREWRVVLPIVVVPDGTLWQVDYDDKGTMSKEPYQVNSSQYYVGHEYAIQLGTRTFRYLASHVEFKTFTGLSEYAHEIASGGSFARRTFESAKAKG